MIGWLSGRLRAKRPPWVLLDVQGVGYEVEAPMSTYYGLPEVGEPLFLYTHQVSREDAQRLYGFARETDRDLFRRLIRVNGVGPKLALAILSGMDASQFALCVQAGDVATLTRLPGIGKRTAERLLMEMRDHLDEAAIPASAVPASEAFAASEDPQQEAVSALVALGYRPQDAARRVRAVAAPGLACEDLIRRALQSAGGS